MAANANPHPPEVIDLLDTTDEESDEDEDEDDDVVLDMMRDGDLYTDPAGEEEAAEGLRQLAGAFPADIAVSTPPMAPTAAGERQVNGGMIIVIDGEEIFIPDEEPQQIRIAEGVATTNDPASRQEPPSAPDQRAFTADDCLQHVLEIFPDISHDHVRSLYATFDEASDFEVLAGRARLDNIVEQLISATSYPRQEKGKLKRKREDSTGGATDTKKWDRSDRVLSPAWLKGPIAAICKADFPTIPRNHISGRIQIHNHLFQTYVALAKDVDDSDEGARVFGRGRAAKVVTADADTIAMNCGRLDIVEELAAARAQVTKIRSEREAAKAKKRAEDENLQKAIAAGETAECSACFDDLPMNRQIHCDGESTHFTCFECAETYIKTEVGDARCKVVCPAGCGSGFAYNQLHLLENKALLEKLAQIQQEQDIRDAGLDDLEECPFCDFKAIMPPIEEDFEFRCANPECERVSCRRCKAISHIPISCEQHAKDNKLSGRHQIEEAMTAALVRSCQKCKKQFIKESGCNKMHCMSCGTLQCYVCSAIVKDYNHFDQGAPRARTVAGSAESKKCPLYDNVEERHEREVKEAEEKARKEVVEANPDISAEDLQIKVSDAVKKADSDRVRRAGVRVPGAFAGVPGLVGAALGRDDFLFWNADEDADHDAEDGDDDGLDFRRLAGLADRRRAARRHAPRGARAAREPRLAPGPPVYGDGAARAQELLARNYPGFFDAPGDPLQALQQEIPDREARVQALQQRLPGRGPPLQGYIPVYFGEARQRFEEVQARLGQAQQQQPPPPPPPQQVLPPAWAPQAPYVHRWAQFMDARDRARGQDRVAQQQQARPQAPNAPAAAANDPVRHYGAVPAPAANNNNANHGAAIPPWPRHLGNAYDIDNPFLAGAWPQDNPTPNRHPHDVGQPDVYRPNQREAANERGQMLERYRRQYEERRRWQERLQRGHEEGMAAERGERERERRPY